MRPGILVQHRPPSATRSELVRGDVVAIVGVIPRDRWPEGAVRGDFVHLRFGPDQPLPTQDAIDAVSLAAAQQFLRNGGVEGHLLGVCVDRAESLLSADVVSNGVLSSAMAHLEGLDSVGLLAMPALAYLPGADTLFTWVGLLEHATRVGHRFVVVDPPFDLGGKLVAMWARRLGDLAGEAASFAAVYFPWLQWGESRVPPSGAVAGLCARTELDHAPFGVHWPPANQPLREVTHPAQELRGPEQRELVEAHVNPIVTIPGRGVVVWGARTLAREGAYQHINTRRIVSGIAEQLRRDSEWAVFEEHRPALWEILARTVRSRLDLLWSSGVVVGEARQPAYDVQCDAELNPPAVRDAGIVNVRVRFQPVSTTEQVIVDLQLGA